MVPCIRIHLAGGLPWWLSGKESTCQCRVRGFDLWSRKMPHADVQLSPCATAPEPTRCNYWSPCTPGSVLCNRRSHHWEACTPQLESSVRSLQLEKALPQKRRPGTIKRKKNTNICIYICDAGDIGLAPGWGTKIPRAAEQLSSISCNYWSLCAATRELTCCNGRTKTQNIQIHKIKKKKKGSFPLCRERHTGNQKEHPYKTLESHGILQFDFQKWRHQEPQRAEQLISQVLKAPPTRLQHWVSSMTSDFV